MKRTYCISWPFSSTCWSCTLFISSSSRSIQQTLSLWSWLLENPGKDRGCFKNTALIIRLIKSDLLYYLSRALLQSILMLRDRKKFCRVFPKSFYVYTKTRMFIQEYGFWRYYTMQWRWQRHRWLKIKFTQIPATAKVPGMSKAEQGDKNHCKV